MAARPTLRTDLVLAVVDFHGYCNACKTRAGEVWLGANRALLPIVWQLYFPVSNQEAMISQTNPTGHISNSNLEMAGMLCQWLVLKHVVDLKHAHVVVRCDNTPTIGWTTKLQAS